MVSLSSTLVADQLRRMISRANEIGLVEGPVVVRNNSLVSHSQFADYIILFLSEGLSAFSNLLTLLEMFKSILALRVNYQNVDTQELVWVVWRLLRMLPCLILIF